MGLKLLNNLEVEESMNKKLLKNNKAYLEEAYRNCKRLNENMTFEEYENDPFIISLKDMCRSYGYELVDFYYSSYYNKPQVEIHKLSSDRPEVYFHPARRGEEPEFRIQTPAVGALSVDEYEGFLSIMQGTISMVKTLQTQLPKLQEKGIIINEEDY